MPKLTSFGRRRSQRGAIILTVALLLLFLLGFMGIAIDIGRLYTVRSELQTAMDACALSAATELDKQATSISRATNAGLSAANLNQVDLQSKGAALTSAGLTFYDTSGITETTDPLAATYVRCSRTQADIATWLLQALGTLSSDPVYSSTKSVFATAVATRVSAQTACPIPIALKAAEGATKPMYGYTAGQWVTVYGKRLGGAGEFGWYNLDGSANARATRDQLESGQCDTRVGDTLGTPGAKTSVDAVWNYRFGIYKNNVDPADHPPDLTGYSYTLRTWPNGRNAWDGDPGAGAPASAANFVTKRSLYRSFDDTGTSLSNGSLVVFGKQNQLNGFQTVASPGASGDHGRYGKSRRVATVPVIDSANKVIDYLCVLMLHPLSGPNDDAQIEVLGNAGAASSPCTTSGLAGGNAGPLVSALVQ